MYLTPSFRSEHFAVSASYPDLVRPVPSAWLDRVRSLAILLEEAQTWLPAGYTVEVTSGYRGSELNRRVGGSPTSAHLSANAVDFTVFSPAGDPATEILPSLWVWASTAWRGRVGELLLEAKHIHLSNPSASMVDRMGSKFAVRFQLPDDPATAGTAAALIVAAALAAITLRRLT